MNVSGAQPWGLDGTSGDRERAARVTARGRGENLLGGILSVRFCALPLRPEMPRNMMRHRERPEAARGRHLCQLHQE